MRKTDFVARRVSHQSVDVHYCIALLVQSSSSAPLQTPPPTGYRSHPCTAAGASVASPFSRNACVISRRSASTARLLCASRSASASSSESRKRAAASAHVSLRRAEDFFAPEDGRSEDPKRTTVREVPSSPPAAFPAGFEPVSPRRSASASATPGGAGASSGERADAKSKENPDGGSFSFRDSRVSTVSTVSTVLSSCQARQLSTILRQLSTHVDSCRQSRQSRQPGLSFSGEPSES